MRGRVGEQVPSRSCILRRWACTTSKGALREDAGERKRVLSYGLYFQRNADVVTATVGDEAAKERRGDARERRRTHAYVRDTGPAANARARIHAL